MVKQIGRLALALIILSQIGATCHGTETGNPTGTSDTANSAIDQLIDLLCLRIHECDSAIDESACTETLNGADGDNLGDKFGLPEGAFTIDGIRSGINDGSIVTNSASLVDCETDIGTITCSVVTNNVLPNHFSNVENVVPDSCQGVFSLSE